MWATRSAPPPVILCLLGACSTLCAVNFGHTACSCRADTVFCYQCCVHGFVIPRNYFPRVGNLSKKLSKLKCRTYSRNTPPPPASSKHWYLHYESYILELVYERILFCWSLRVRWHNVSTGISRLWLSRRASCQFQLLFPLLFPKINVSSFRKNEISK